MPLLTPFWPEKPFKQRRPKKEPDYTQTIAMLLASRKMLDIKDLLRREIPKCKIGKPMKCNILPQCERSAIHLCRWLAAYDNTIEAHIKPYGIVPSPAAQEAGYSQLQEVWIARKYERDYVKEPLTPLQVMFKKRKELGL